MSATYNELLLTDLDTARDLLGDTIVEPATAAQHSDEHITAVLGRYGYARGVARLADELVMRYAQAPSNVGLSQAGISVSWPHRVPELKALASRMRAQAAAAESTSGSSGGTAAASQDTAVEVCW